MPKITPPTPTRHKKAKWVGEFAPNLGHDPHNPFPLAHTFVCEHEYRVHFLFGWWIFKREYAVCDKCGHVAKVKKIV